MLSRLLSEPPLFLGLQPGSLGLVALGHSCEFTVSVWPLTKLPELVLLPGQVPQPHR